MCWSVFQIAYSPTNNKGASSVSHLCAPGNTFAAPSTFPMAHTAEEYSEAHAHVMSALNDLHIVQFDVVVAKGLPFPPSFIPSCSLPVSSTAPNNLETLTYTFHVILENFVSLRYTATGSHIGTAHNGIPPTRRKAQWTAAGNFVIDNTTGKIQHWWKDWDKMQSAHPTSCVFLNGSSLLCGVCSVEAAGLGLARQRCGRICLSTTTSTVQYILVNVSNILTASHTMKWSFQSTSD